MSAFETTHWSTVLAAGSESTARSRAALATLCETYWYPLYAYLRRRGHSVEDAEDLTQGFFTRVLDKGLFHVADPERGRFRSFLLTSLKNYVAHERDREQALKRGGGVPALSLEFEGARRQYLKEPEDGATPETVFDRRWALTILDRVLARLREDYRGSGKEALFDHLEPHLIGAEHAGPGREVATALGMSEGSVRVAIHRARQRFGRVLREEIAQTVADPAQVEGEIRHLIQSLAG